MENTNDGLTPEQKAADAMKSVASDTANNVVEEKTAELKESFEATMTQFAAEAKADRELMQKSIDEVAAERKSVFGIGGAKLNEKQEQLKEIAETVKAGKNIQTELSTKTFTPGTSTNTLVPSMYNQEGNIKYDPNYKTNLRDVLISRTSDGGSILWNREVAGTVGDAGVNPQGITDASAPKAFGSAQPQTTKSVGRQESTFRTLTNFYTMPEEYLDDIAGFESYISTRLMADLMDLESRQLLNGSGAGINYNGINSAAGLDHRALAAGALDTALGAWANSVGSAAANSDANRYDALVAASSILQQDDYNPGCVILNPFDFNQIAITKSNDGDYVFRQGIDPGTGKLKTWLNTGAEVVMHNAQAANTFTVFDKSAIEYVMREGVAVEFDRNANDFASNNISIRAQLRGNLADWLPNGIITGLFETAGANIGYLPALTGA